MSEYPDFTPVVSSNIVALSYQQEASTLYVEFSNGKTYSYSGVPQSIYESFLHDPSPGSYFANNIKGVYPYKRV